MPIANYSDWLTAIKSKPQYPFSPLSSLGGSAGNPLFASWRDPFNAVVPALTAPTTAVTCDRTTAGAFGQNNTTSGDNFLIQAFCRDRRPSALLLADRLSHQGGLSGTVTTTQTTNLPTAALTRYTSGEGVWIAITVYSQVGSTSATVSASYTNSAGVSGKTASATWNPSGSYNNRDYGVLFLGLQRGDTGVRSVESVTLSGSTGTAGNFGVTLIKPLAMSILGMSDLLNANFVDGNLIGGIPSVPNDACLWPYFFYDSTAGNSPSTVICLTES